MRSWLVYKLLQRDTLELVDMKSNRAKANQELLFHGRSSFRSPLWALCLQWFDMTCYPYRWRGLAGRRNIASNGGKWSQIVSKLQDMWKTKSLGPPLQRPCTLQKPGAILFANISSCCAVGQACTLPTIIDSLDSITRLLRHRVCSLQSATVFSQSLPLVTFISKRCHARCQQRISGLFRQNLMPVGLASIATSRLLNQCWASSPRQHSKCN